MRKLVPGLAITALLLASTPSLAETPRDVRDLVDARGSSGEQQMLARGYVNTGGSKSHTGSYTYWWNAKAQECVTVLTSDGRYKAITTSPAVDCGHQNVEKKHDDGTGAAIAVGAAALIGVIALSHKSHHHEDGKHQATAPAEASYERGYRDGLYGTSYHNYGDERSYSSGYSAGVDQRNHETSYRPRYDRGGYGSHQPVSDLAYQDWSWAKEQLGNRGFRRVSKEDGAGELYAVYYNDSTRQCVNVTVRDQRTTDVSNISPQACR